jgi:hypothetical protein
VTLSEPNITVVSANYFRSQVSTTLRASSRILHL